MQFSISFKFIFSHSLYTFYVSRAQKLRFHTERHENMSKFLLPSPDFSPHAVPLSQYFQESTPVLPRQYWSTGKEVLATIKGL